MNTWGSFIQQTPVAVMPVLVWQTWRWETFDDYYLLKRVVSAVTLYSLDPFWTLWWRPLGSNFWISHDFDETFWPTMITGCPGCPWLRLSQLFIVVSVWRFLKAKWQMICEAFYDKQDSWILCSSFGFICSLCTWCLDFRSKISYVCLVARVKIFFLGCFWDTARLGECYDPIISNL